MNNLLKNLDLEDERMTIQDVVQFTGYLNYEVLELLRKRSYTKIIYTSLRQLLYIN